MPRKGSLELTEPLGGVLDEVPDREVRDRRLREAAFLTQLHDRIMLNGADPEKVGVASSHAPGTCFKLGLRRLAAALADRAACAAIRRAWSSEYPFAFSLDTRPSKPM